MESQENVSTDSYGLVAFGSSRGWDVSIDESLDRDNEWWAQIECPNVYLDFQVDDLDVVSQAIQFLKQHLDPCGPTADGKAPPSQSDESPPLGKFGQTNVSLLWDSEGPRCILLARGPEAGSALRVTMDKDDASALLEALEHVAQELPLSDEAPSRESSDGAGHDGVPARRTS